MFARKESRTIGREETPSTTTMPGRTRRRTDLEGRGRDEPQRGRRIYAFLQSRRQGTPAHTGHNEPTPRRQEVESYSPQEALPSERGASRGKRIAWSLGALTAIGGAGAFAIYRRNRNQRGRREEW